MGKRAQKKLKRVANPRTPPSIPSKFDSQVSKSTQFLELYNCGGDSNGDTYRSIDGKIKANVLPGPGHYRPHSMETYRSGSMSSRGFTPMISLDPRFGSDIEEVKSRIYPGPGTYKPNYDTTKPTAPKTSFGGNVNSGTKRKLRKSTSSPGPGSYKLDSKPVWSNLGAASFKFTARSNLLLQQGTLVAVGSYDVGAVYDYMERRKDFPDPAFRSGTSRLAPTESKSLAPAPGYYEVIEPQDRDKLYRPSACFDTGLDRFGRSSNVRIPREEVPGPNSYSPIDKLKKDNLGAVASFASSSTRFEDDVHIADHCPGPQSYNPLPAKRKSFLQNRYCQWV